MDGGFFCKYSFIYPSINMFTATFIIDTKQSDININIHGKQWSWCHGYVPLQRSACHLFCSNNVKISP